MNNTLNRYMRIIIRDKICIRVSKKFIVSTRLKEGNDIVINMSSSIEQQIPWWVSYCKHELHILMYTTLMFLDRFYFKNE